MKNFIFAVVVILLGAGAAAAYLKYSKRTPAPDSPQAVVENSQLEKSADHNKSSELLHGGDANAAALPACAKHNIPSSICAFCDPALIEKLGFCHGHDVPEAFCTRCSPILIGAFKIEGDWCVEHGLPESQCEQCKGQRANPTKSG